MLFKSLWKSESGVALIMFAIALPIIMLIMALAVDMNKVQGGKDTITSATDSSASAVSEYILLNAKKNVRDSESKELTQDELESVALDMVKTNITNYAGVSELVPGSFNLAMDNENITVSACLLVKPNTLAGSAGLSSEQQVCSNSVAPIICPAGTEWNGTQCKSECNKFLYEIEFFQNRGAPDNYTTIFNDRASPTPDIKTVDVFDDEKLVIQAGTNYADTDQYPCVASGIDYSYNGTYRYNDMTYNGVSEAVMNAGTRWKDDRFKCSVVLRNYQGSRINTNYWSTNMKVLYEPGMEPVKTAEVLGSSEPNDTNYIKAEYKGCVMDNSPPVTYKLVESTEIKGYDSYTFKGVVKKRPIYGETDEYIAGKNSMACQGKFSSDRPFYKRPRMGNELLSRRDYGEYCQDTFLVQGYVRVGGYSGLVTYVYKKSNN